MKAVLMLIVLLVLVMLFAFGGYLAEQTHTNTKEDVTLIITTLGNSSIERFDYSGQSVLDLLRSGHEVGATNSYLRCIDGVCGGKEYFWSLYVNGKMVPKSAAYYKPEKGDLIEIKLGKGG